jgi:hypothetical protein
MASGDIMRQEIEEEWRPVPSRPGIWASSCGRVHRRSSEGLAPQGARSAPTFGTIVRQRVGRDGEYVKRVVQWRGFGLLLVSRLVCEAWHGPAPFDGAVVMHLDDDSLSNIPSNLKWATQWENLSTRSSKPRLDAARRENARARWGSARTAA